MIITEKYDESIIKEVRGYQKLLDAFDISLKDKNVLDLGAHKGFFSRYALDHGARSVVAVEPCSSNVKVLRRNARKASILHGACIGWRMDEKIALTKAKKMKYSAAYSIARKSSAREIVEWVWTYYFADLSENNQSEIVKMDFQGSEWGVFNARIPKCVRVMFGEIHYSGRFEIAAGIVMKKPPLKDKFTTSRVLANMKRQGFSLYFRRARKWYRSPPYGTKSWFQDVVFIRREK